MELSQDSADAQHLTALPAEILHHVLMWLDPASLATAARVCRLLYRAIKGNKSLWRGVYLLCMDKPEDMDLDWEQELYDVIKLDSIFSPRRDADKEAHQLPFVCNAVFRLLKNASFNNNGGAHTHPVSKNIEHLRGLFANELAAHVFMQQSSLFERMKTTRAWVLSYRDCPPKEEHQMSAKLHCLYGKPILKAGRTRSASSYPYACSRVYDLRLYTGRTKWGPFRDDDTGRVDWEKVEAINIVIAKNVWTRCPQADILDDVWDTPFFGSHPRSFVPSTLPDPTDLDAQDPYGITGSWYRIVCFLDYNDFFHYNFSMGGLVPEDTPRPPLNVDEALRLIIMKLHVTHIEPPGPDDGQDLPVVHYEGESRSINSSPDDEPHSGIQGTVRLTKEGEVRWTSISIFGGVERWKSEGIQVGGIKSARGVVGTWFDRDFDVHGPAGPTAFWKAADAENPRQALLEGMTGILVDPSGLVEELEVNVDEIEFLDDDDEEEDWDQDLEPISDELPGLLQDAEMDLLDVVPHVEHT